MYAAKNPKSVRPLAISSEGVGPYRCVIYAIQGLRAPQYLDPVQLLHIKSRISASRMERWADGQRNGKAKGVARGG